MSQILLAVTILLMLLHDTTNAYCKYKGGKICEGAVTKEYKTILQLCQNGKLKYKKKSKVKPGYPIAGQGGGMEYISAKFFIGTCFVDCEWYGDVICNGSVIRVSIDWIGKSLIVPSVFQGSVSLVV